VRRPSPFTERRDPVDIKMTPMIDVVFLLMIYFIWSSSFGAAERLLPSKLSAQTSGAGQSPSETPPPEEDFEKLVIRIVGNAGNIGWTVNEQPMNSLAELQSRLLQLARIKSDAPVVLHPDPDVPLEHVIDVFDMSRLVGFQKVQFAVNAP